MAKRASTEEKLMAIRALGREPTTADTRKALGKALNGANNILAAEAAKVAGRLGLVALIPELRKAFDRFIDNPLKRDQGCLAKEAVIEALDALEYDDEAIFFQGIEYFQIEPAYLRPVDTAAILRGKCAFALVRIGCPGVVFNLVGLLTDPEPQARIAAVKALTGIHSDISEPLLRLKARQGDEDQQVVAECLFALMQINPENSIDFVARFLGSDDLPVLGGTALILAENAALAIGESKLDRAFEILQGRREQSMDPEFQDMLLMPIALSRLERAFEYLIYVIENDQKQSAVAAADAIRIFGDESHLPRIRKAVTHRDDSAITNTFNAWFLRA
jgi:HEAT repeat protein